MTATRRQAREWAIQILTAAELNPPEDMRQFMDEYWSQIPTLEDDEGGSGGEVIRGKLKAFAEDRVMGVINNREEIDGLIIPRLNDWDLYRLGTVERCVLRMGVWELKFTDIPVGVVINEAIDLANWFSSSKSRQIINAVLDNYAKSIR